MGLCLVLLCTISWAQDTRPATPTAIHLERGSQTLRSIGMAKVNITPRRPILLSGYAARNHQLVSQVTLPLWARGMAIGTDEEGPNIIIVVDNCGVPAKLRDAVAEELQNRYQILPDRVTICSTHTHSAPMLTGVLENLLLRELTPQDRDAVDGYTQELFDHLVEVAGEALKNRAPSSLHLGQGKTTFAMNRRNGVVTDHATPVLVVAGEQGQVRGIIANYACHCVSAGAGPDIHGDWAGCAAVDIEAAYPEATAMILIGCGADQNPSAARGYESTQELGRTLADEVLRVLTTQLRPINGAVTTDFSKIQLDFAAVPTKEELEERSKQSGVVGFNAGKLLAKLERGESLPQTLTYPVQTVTFGKDLAMVFLGGEVVVDYVLDLKKELDPNRLWVTAYSNDVPCYIPSDRVLKQRMYEGLGSMDWYGHPSPLAMGTETTILNQVLKQLRDLKEWKHHIAKTGGTRPLSPEEAIASMKVREGFRVELVAAEPLVVDPVAIDFGPDGKLWVAEMRDYPEGVPGVDGPGGTIRFLEDTDGDGRYDKSTLFLEGVAFPTGITAWQNGVLICSAPDVIYAEDTNGDGRADIREVLLSGFATHNYQARVNSLSLGLDNWLHGAAGIFGGMITAEGMHPVDAQNRDFRFQPDSKKVEAVSGRTQQGRARDDWGNWLGCSNTRLLLHYPLTESYYARNPRVPVPNPDVNTVRNQQLFPIGELVQFAASGPSGRPTSVCGLSIYRDTLLGPEFSNNAFMCEPVNQLVHRRTMEPRLSYFAGNRAAGEEQSEFLASTDNWFRPVQTRTGPDGALYVVDMSRYVIEHPKFISDEVKSSLDLRAGDQQGRIYRVLPEGTEARRAPVVRNMTNRELVNQLETPNGTLRDLAHLELLGREAADVTAELKQLAWNGSTPQARVHAIAVLDGLNTLDGETLLGVFSKEEHPGVLRTAIRVSEPFLDSSSQLVQQLISLADHADPQVRLQLAYSLGEAHGKGTAGALAKLLAGAHQDPYLQSAALSSLTPGTIQDVLMEMSRQQGNRAAAYPVAILAAETAEPSVVQEFLQQEFGAGDAQLNVAQLKLLGSIRRALERRQLPLHSQRQFWTNILQQCHQLAENPKVPVDQRMAAIALLPLGDNHSQAIQALTNGLVPQQPLPVQEASLNALAAMKGADAKGALFDALRSLAPRSQTIALNQICSQPELTLELLRRLEIEALPRTLIDSSRKQQLANSPNPEIRERAERLFEKPSNSEVAAQLAAARGADLTGGDQKLGRDVFVKHCTACHRSGGVGHEVGPDLESLTDRSKDFLVTSIFDPNAAIDRRYATYAASLVDGRIFTGILTSEGENSIVLKEKEGITREVLRSDLEELSDTGKSMMPDGLGREISLEEMRHLLAFLKGTRLEASAAPASTSAP